MYEIDSVGDVHTHQTQIKKVLARYTGYAYISHVEKNQNPFSTGSHGDIKH